MLNTRRRFQDIMRPEATKLVEGLTRRTVIGFMSDNHLDPDLAAEVFVLECPDEPGELPQVDSAEAER